MYRAIAIATIVAGTLDILFAICLTLGFGRDVGDMLRYVGSGALPSATALGAGGMLLGLLVHFALMAIMATAFVWVAAQWPALLARPIIAGIAYGLITYVIMNWLVVPLRFDTPLPPKALSIVTQLFAHIALVGIPIALIAARTMQSSSRS